MILLVALVALINGSKSTDLPVSSSRRDLSWITVADRYVSFARDNKDEFTSESGLRETNSSALSCYGDLLYIEEQMMSQVFTSMPGWLISLIDSMGKPASGLQSGAILWPGYYPECVNGVKSTSSHHSFEGRYCTLTWSITMANGTIKVPISQGICVPSTCKSLEIKQHIELVKNILLFASPKIRQVFSSHVNLTSVYCHPRIPGERSLNTNGKVSLILLTLIVTLSLATTIALFALGVRKDRSYELFRGPVTLSTIISADTIFPRSSVLHELFSCFHIPDNLHLLVNGSLSRKDKSNSNLRIGRISCLSGIRFFSMVWVILAHTFIFAIAYTNNLIDLLQAIKNSLFASIFILNGSFCVDSFFVLGGLLCAYRATRSPREPARTEETTDSSESDERSNYRYYSLPTPQVTWLPVYRATYFLLTCLGRIMRLVPLYLVVLMVDWTLADQASSGPFWDYGDQVTSERVLCENSWWYNILFINNFLPISKQCMAWTWYLANDVQFFLVASIILFIINSINRRAGFFLLFLTLVFATVATWSVSLANDLNTGFPDLISRDAMQISPDAVTPYLDLLYTKPYARIGAYLIGLMLGISLAEKSLLITSRMQSNCLMRWTIFVSSLILLTSALFANYHLQLSPVTAAFYNSLSRISWSLGLALLIALLHATAISETSCIFHSMNSFLSSDIFTPLSNLTYCAYLIHPIVIGFFYRSALAPILYSPSQMLLLFFASVTCVYLVSIPLYIFIEAPINRMFKLIIKS